MTKVQLLWSLVPKIEKSSYFKLVSNAETVKCLLAFKRNTLEVVSHFHRKSLLLWQFKMFSALILATMTEAPKMPLERSRDQWILLNYSFRKILRMWAIWSGISDRIKGKPQPRFQSMCQVSSDTFLTWRYKSVKTTWHRSVVFCARACVCDNPLLRERAIHPYTIVGASCMIISSPQTFIIFHPLHQHSL